MIVVLENLSAHEATPAQRLDGNAPGLSPSVELVVFQPDGRQGARFTQSHFGRTPYGSICRRARVNPITCSFSPPIIKGCCPRGLWTSVRLYSGNALRDRQGAVVGAPRAGKVGVANNNVPNRWLPFTSPNLGAAIMKTGGTFASFSESPLPKLELWHRQLAGAL